MIINSVHYLWVERYRPDTIFECILPPKLKSELQTQVDNKEIQHLLFHGVQGSGKTTAAFAIAKEIEADVLVVNASDERGIDLFRNKIKQFASSVSLMGKPKIVILEEGDQLLPDSQKILRRIMEEFAKNTKFIITCNYPSKIIPALHSRMASYSFNATKEDRNSLGGLFLRRVQAILTENDIKYDDKVLVEFILKFFPDYRKILNELQKYSLNGAIDGGIFVSNTSNLKEYITLVLKKDFKGARTFIGENSLDSDFYGTLYNQVIDHKEYPREAVPNTILTIAEYQYKHAFAVDTELNMAAMSIELMSLLP